MFSQLLTLMPQRYLARSQRIIVTRRIYRHHVCTRGKPCTPVTHQPAHSASSRLRTLAPEYPRGSGASDFRASRFRVFPRFRRLDDPRRDTFPLRVEAAGLRGRAACLAKSPGATASACCAIPARDSMRGFPCRQASFVIPAQPVANRA